MALCLILLCTQVPAAFGATGPKIAIGSFAKYKLTEQLDFPIVVTQTTRQNVTETVLKQNSTGTLVQFEIQIANQISYSEQFFPNGSMVFPYIGVSSFSNSNATISQLRSSFNLTFIQPNSTRTGTPSLTAQNIDFNGSTYQGNLYADTISMTVNLTQAFNLRNQTQIPPLPLNIDLSILTFPSDLVYNLTATSNINIGYTAGTGKLQMTLLSTNLSPGDPIPTLPWYTALVLIIPLGLLAYLIYRRRRAAKRLAQQVGQPKPDYWVR